MIKKIFGIAIVVVLLYWFYHSENFWTISWWIALFLFWMIFLWQWFKELTWGWFEKVLKKITNKVWKSMTLWAFWAAVMQSSSLVTIIAISFLSADLIPLAQGIAISLWSNIWTTTWAWIMAELWTKAGWISGYAMPIIVFWLLFLIQKSKNLKWIWNILLWIWVVFIWVWYIQEWFSTLSKSINLLEYSVDWFRWVLTFVLIWMVFTLLLQSSHATILLIMAALWANQVTYENALCLTIWANIWTTFTWILWSLNSNVNWKRLAIADVLSKTITWIIFIFLLNQIIPIVDLIASNIGFSETDYAFKLAIFHTFFNIIWVMLILPFYWKFVKFVEYLIPEKKINLEENFIRNIYLNEASIELPNTAIASLIKETWHMYDNSIIILMKILWLTSDDLKYLIEDSENYQIIKNKIKIYNWDIDRLYGEKIKILFWEIMDFSAQAQAKNPWEYFEEFSIIRRANLNIIETVKTLKHIQRNLERFLNSSNQSIKTEYEKIIFDMIYVITEISKIKEVSEHQKKIKILASIWKYISDNDIINNWKIDELIRNKIISNEMATSLIKDTNYKNEICNKLLLVWEILYNRELFKETENKRKYKNKDNWISKRNKKLEKLISKFKKKKSNLKAKLAKEKNKDKKLDIRKEIEEIDFILEKYQN